MRRPSTPLGSLLRSVLGFGSSILIWWNLRGDVIARVMILVFAVGLLASLLVYLLRHETTIREFQFRKVWPGDPAPPGRPRDPFLREEPFLRPRDYPITPTPYGSFDPLPSKIPTTSTRPTSEPPSES